MYAAETNGDQIKTAVEEGISDEVAQKLQEKSSVLTQLRKQKGKKLPEELASVDEIKALSCVGSHTVSVFFFYLLIIFVLCPIIFKKKRVYTALVLQA